MPYLPVCARPAGCARCYGPGGGAGGVIGIGTVTNGKCRYIVTGGWWGTGGAAGGGGRPEHCGLGGLGVEMGVDVVEELGADAYRYGRITGSGKVIDAPIVARVDGRNPPEKGSRVRLHPAPGHLHFFGRNGQRIG